MLMRLIEWLWSLNPKNREWLETLQPPTDEIDAEISQITDEVRHKAAVAAAKAEIIDDLKKALEAARNG